MADIWVPVAPALGSAASFMTFSNISSVCVCVYAFVCGWSLKDHLQSDQVDPLLLPVAI